MIDEQTPRGRNGKPAPATKLRVPASHQSTPGESVRIARVEDMTDTAWPDASRIAHSVGQHQGRSAELGLQMLKVGMTNSALLDMTEEDIRRGIEAGDFAPPSQVEILLREAQRHVIDPSRHRARQLHKLRGRYHRTVVLPSMGSVRRVDAVHDEIMRLLACRLDTGRPFKSLRELAEDVEHSLLRSGRFHASLSTIRRTVTAVAKALVSASPETFPVLAALIRKASARTAGEPPAPIGMS